MKLYALLTALLLCACASHTVRDRTETQREYEIEEARNQKKSLTRSELMAKSEALTSQIVAIDSQITNQRDLIKNWQSQSNVASSKAMIDNAKIRIKHLLEEKAALLNQKKDLQSELENL